jgi:hypothetical protein
MASACNPCFLDPLLEPLDELVHEIRWSTVLPFDERIGFGRLGALLGGECRFSLGTGGLQSVVRDDELGQGPLRFLVGQPGLEFRRAAAYGLLLRMEAGGVLLVLVVVAAAQKDVLPLLHLLLERHLDHAGGFLLRDLFRQDAFIHGRAAVP